jgi:hypothetical protein
MRSYEKLSTFGPSPGKTLSGRKNAPFCARQVCHGVTDVPRVAGKLSSVLKLGRETTFRAQKGAILRTGTVFFKLQPMAARDYLILAL